MVALEREPVDVRLVRTIFLDPVGDREEVLGVPAPDLVGLAARLEPLERVGADRLQHREARLAVGLLLLAEQAVVDQRREAGQDARAAADRLGGLERAAADEDGEPREERLLVRPEQRVAPVDRRAQRLLARGQVARAAGEQVEALLEPGEQRLRREQLRARGRQLDRERQAVEPDADLGDRRRVRARDGEVGLDRLRALDEERDRLVLRQRRELRQMRRVGQRSAAAPGTRARRRGGAASGS